WRSFSKKKIVVICAKPSRASPITLSTPLIPWIASSTGSRISRSTWSGEAPGYTIVVNTIGGLTSGNSSVCRFSSANMPNTTSASIATIVTSGRLMAKSEMSMVVGLGSCSWNRRAAAALPVSPSGRRDAVVRRRPWCDRGAGRDSLGRTCQQRVARRNPAQELHGLRSLVHQPHLHFHALHHAAAHSIGSRRQAAAIHRQHWHHHGLVRLRLHPPLGEQPAHQLPFAVGNGHLDAHLTSARV